MKIPVIISIVALLSLSACAPRQSASNSNLTGPGTWVDLSHDFAADTKTWIAPGNHMTMLSAPHVDRLAGWLHPLLGGGR